MSKSEENHSLSKLLFELSSPDRTSLLNALRSSSLKLSQLAQKSSATVQETSRHLERLSPTGLVVKNSEGEYVITSVGRLCLDQLESLNFVVHYRDYLSGHDLSFLPEKFIHRLGELTKSDYAATVTEVLHHTEAVLEGAREYVLLMADQALIPTYSTGVSFVRNSGVIWKSIIPRSVFSSLPALDIVPENTEIRFLDDPKVAIAMNEKLAGVSFSDLKGRLDMSAGFKGTDKAFHDWCYELFLHYWESSRIDRETPLRTF